ncbi:Bug family tripartite tricarboxylate transporter substrate binding protein [Roseomonas sp. BN140053]|uniref:Bug family tripartite tricarboxylate transporter substrate binding protein n=1 Tax=Roseomonas sp. BN140053 TaxID=3391898 RepID=UPI0039EAEAD4
MTTRFRRRTALGALLLLSALALPAAAQAPAQPTPAQAAPAQAAPGGWAPDRPVRVIVPGAPGSGADTAARAVAQRMAEFTRATIVVENQAGGGGVVGILSAARARPDGLTLLAAVSGVLLGPLIDRSLPYDAGRDLAAVSQFHRTAVVLMVTNATPARTLAEFAALVRGAPGQFNMGNFGYGSSSHLISEMIAKRAGGLQWQTVPFQSSPPLIRDMLAGHICCGVSDIGSAREMLRDRMLRPLAVSGAARSEALPEVPTLSEQGVPGLEVAIWQGMFAPAGTPAPILEYWGRAVAHAVRQPELVRLFRDIGAEPVGNTPSEFNAYLGEQRALWQQIVDETGIRIQ